MTFGMKFGSWAWALKRAQTRLEQAREVAATGAPSAGPRWRRPPASTYEKKLRVAEGLTPDPLSTQVLARDRHAQVMCALACAAATLESIAMQVRLLQQTDVIEAEEPFKKARSANRPCTSKRNPITVERACASCRWVKANTQVALDVALWYEHDHRHRHRARGAGRQPAPRWTTPYSPRCDGSRTPCKPIRRRWKTRVAHQGASSFQQRNSLALVNTGITREEAYVIVQRNAMAVWEDIQNAVDGPTYRESSRERPGFKLSSGY